MDKKDNKILVTKEDGTQVEMTILLTYKNEENGLDYVLYYDENDESGEVFPFRYDEKTHKLSELEDEKEWEVASEVLDSFLEDQEE